MRLADSRLELWVVIKLGMQAVDDIRYPVRHHLLLLRLHLPSQVGGYGGHILQRQCSQFCLNDPENKKKTLKQSVSNRTEPHTAFPRCDQKRKLRHGR